MPEQEELTRPSLEPYVPAGHGVGDKEPRGQKLPAGQRVEMPVKQEKPAGQTTQLSARMRLLLLSPTYRVPAEFTVTPMGLLKREAVP